MSSQYHILDRTDNLNPQWMQAVNGKLCELLGRLLCLLITGNYIMINNENINNLSADSLQAPQIQIIGHSSQVRAKDNDIIMYTICTGYKENIVVLKYFVDYLCHWNWFLLSILIFDIVLYICLIRRGGCHWQGTASGNMWKSRSFVEIRAITEILRPFYLPNLPQWDFLY